MKIEIVDNIKEKMKKDNRYTDEILRDKKKIDKKAAEKTLIITPETFAKIFSPERMRLILKIKDTRQMNIYQLAKELDRKYEAVHRDIKLLEGFGIIKIKDDEKKKIPEINSPIIMPKLASA